MFSVGSVWLIVSVNYNEQQNIWNVHLRTSNELNKQLEDLLETELPQGRTLFVLGDIVQKLGDSRVAEYFYQCILEDSDITEEERGIVNYTIGVMRVNDGDLVAALTYLEKAVSLVKVPSFSRSVLKENLTVSRLVMLYRMGRIHSEPFLLVPLFSWSLGPFFPGSFVPRLLHHDFLLRLVMLRFV